MSSAFKVWKTHVKGLLIAQFMPCRVIIILFSFPFLDKYIAQYWNIKLNQNCEIAPVVNKHEVMAFNTYYYLILIMWKSTLTPTTTTINSNILKFNIYLYNISFWFSNLISWELFPAVRYSSDNRTPTVCITRLAVFLTASVMADIQIHYNFINNIVFCHGM